MKPKALKLTDDVKLMFEKHIKLDWSPEQICGRLKSDGILNLHHETIYHYILTDKQSGGELYKHRRHQNKTHRKRYGAAHYRHGIPRTDIDERPEVANKRHRVGNREAKTVMGKNHKGAIVTLNDRKSKLRLAMPTGSKKAHSVTDAMITLFEPLKRFVKTITFDNGKEFAFHEEIAKQLRCDTYFA